MPGFSGRGVGSGGLEWIELGVQTLGFSGREVGLGGQSRGAWEPGCLRSLGGELGPGN